MRVSSESEKHNDALLHMPEFWLIVCFFLVKDFLLSPSHCHRGFSGVAHYDPYNYRLLALDPLCNLRGLVILISSFDQKLAKDVVCARYLCLVYYPFHVGQLVSV